MTDAVPPLLPESGRPPPAPPFFWSSLVIFGGFLFGGAQVPFFVSALIGGVLGYRAAALHHPVPIEVVQTATLVPTLVLSAVFSSGALVALSRLLARQRLRRHGIGGLGLVPAPRRLLFLGLLSGLGLGLVSSFVSPFLKPVPDPETIGPLAVAIARPGLTRAVWTIYALLVAPFAEEFAFRGVLLTGFRQRLSSTMAATAVAGIFTLTHVAQYWKYWPALVFILLLGLLTAAWRVRSGSLGPAVAAHLAFNVIAIAVLFAS